MRTNTLCEFECVNANTNVNMRNVNEHSDVNVNMRTNTRVPSAYTPQKRKLEGRDSATGLNTSGAIGHAGTRSTRESPVRRASNPKYGEFCFSKPALATGGKR